MAKEIAFENDARSQMAAGVHELAEAVRVTLGPKGRYVALQKKDQKRPNLSNDGAMVAANVDLENPVGNIGMKVVREAAMGTNIDAGDGTTTATILADAMIQEGMRLVLAGTDPLALRRGINKAVAAVVADVEAHATEVSTAEQMAEVATVSSGDPEIGAKIAEALAEIGKDGIISVEKSNTMGIEIDIQKGLMFEHGLMAPDMADDFGRMTAELHEPYILITDQRLADNFSDVIPMLEEVMKSGHPLLVLADDIRGESFKNLMLNRRKGTLKTVGVQAPGLMDGDRRKTETEDVAILTGGTYFTPDKGLSLKDARKDLLGRADTVMITKDRCVIIGGKGKPEAIEARCAQIRAQIDDKNSGYDQDVLRERLSKLTGGIAVMRVGAPTESEMEEMRIRIQDALLATRSAAKHGLVPGGGVAFLNSVPALDALVDLPEDEARGVDVVRQALEVPVRTLAENSGFEPSVVVEKTRELPYGEGLNCADGTYGPMIPRGISDPTFVTKTALEMAASVAGLVLITDAAVYDAPKKNSDAEED
ncbi:chaperonin GroEL [Xiamenia xianingshaonis]|uniref:60 kDa chaperonin n=1 Tax=Xiamenia xianingshaonis TaxID=2682776 RepID=A0A9E6MQD8_9ACTN|nr:chaperonin GroEL [Xiamenia xianingshaonis]NHM14619.1 chaperonin GroEL [Xiamenia xianingshaonis]QTU84341.1 chaperonin GroEL [Xiamenia xianingshaonis]